MPPLRASLVIYVVVWVFLLSACSASEDAVETPVVAPEDSVLTPAAFATLSEEEAVEAAKAEAGHIIGDSPIQEATAEFTTWAGAHARLADRGFEKESRSPGNPGLPLDDTAVWLAILKGLFYEPQGPSSLTDATARPGEPVCAEIIVLLIDPGAHLQDNTDLASQLTLLPADSCS